MEFTYLPTEKNLPALEFITSIGDQYRNEAEYVLDFSSGTLGKRGIRSRRKGADRA